MRRLAVASLAIAALLAVSSTGLAESPDKTITVEAKEWGFSPNEFDAKVGQTIEVELNNEGNVAHSYDVKPLGISSEKIQPGESTTVTFTVEEKGDIQFVCDVPGHKDLGMKGTIHVEEE